MRACKDRGVRVCLVDRNILEKRSQNEEMKVSFMLKFVNIRHPWRTLINSSQ